MSKRTARRFKHVLVALLLAMEGVGPRLYTVSDAFGGARSYAGPNACYDGIPGGLQKISKGKAFAQAFKEFFSEPRGGSSAVSESRSSAKVRELEKSSPHADSAPVLNVIAVPLSPQKKPRLGAALALKLPQDASPVVPFHLNSKK